MTLPLFGGAPIEPARTPELRRYQQEALSALRQYVTDGIRRVLVTMPTGAGKMVLAASLIKTSTVPVMFVAHRGELLAQCVRELARLGITHVSVMRSDDDRYNPDASITVASIQTLARRDKPKAGIVIVDEAHGAASESYRKHVFGAYPDAIIIGLTASPTRLDGKPLGGALFEKLLVVTTYSKLIAQGHIVEPIGFSTPPPDLRSVMHVAGDFAEDDLAKVMNDSALVGRVVEHWSRLAHKHPKAAAYLMTDGGPEPTRELGGAGMVDGPRRPTFCFAVNIDHSQSLAARFEKAGARVAHLDGKTLHAERQAILSDLGSGQLDVVCSVAVLLEGIDVPAAKCVVHARPTLSLVLWLQSTGRIMRPYCPACRHNCGTHASMTPMILDHAGNWDRHGAPHLDRVWSLTDVARVASGSSPMKACPSCGAMVASGRITCPYCGAEFPKGQGPNTSENDVMLQIRASLATDIERRAFFDEAVRKAMRFGFKPGFASAQFKDRFGTWPPRSWSDEVKIAFEADGFWQARLAKRLQRKAEEEAAMARVLEEEAAAGLVGGGEDPGEPPGEFFADWLEDQGIT